ncbi:fungal-specific transcription factor domain-containing protein [Cytidiella melzeri]|nr:fungal-specific transcription factor domain-containing protein [Cytidiella melzeri]
MDYGEYELDLGAPKDRPLKRPRQVKDCDDGLRPYASNSVSTGVQPDADANNEQQVKKGGRKRPLSCGECRRCVASACDRVFPCQSCRKRGCAEICPDGALTGGKGSRFILANTEQLHDKIKLMSDRIRDLESGLQTVQLKVSQDEHPLLRQDLLAIKKSPDLFGIEQQMAHNDSAQDVTSKAEESLRELSAASSSKDADDERTTTRISTSSGEDQPSTSGLTPDHLARLSRAFPSPWTISLEIDLNTRQQLRQQLPPREDAQRLCEQVRQNAFWQFHPDPSESFLPNLIHSVYTTPLSALMPHRLGLFLMILAIGSCVDLDGAHREHDSKQLAEHYYYLARVALCEIPLMDDTSFDAVQALFLMEWYLLSFSDDKKALENAWGILGLTVKLAQSITLHRDGVRSKIIPEERDKRRSLFWNLVRTDARLSLALRRPPSISMRHVDVKRPTAEDNDHVITEYVWWQNDFLVECTIPVVDATMSVKPVPYPEILTLDRKVRNFNIPLALQMVFDTDSPPPTRPLAMQQALIASSRLCTIMHLHRSYFTVALTSNEEFTVQHAYAPSVLAVYAGSCSLISAISTVYQWEPELSTRYSIFWNNCFSAACALCFLVSRAPSLPIAPNALQELDKVSHLFMEIRHCCSKVASYYTVLYKLVARAREHYVAWKSGSPLPRDEMTDEISILVRKVLPTAANTPAAPTVAVADPFALAHPYLRRCLEHATAPDPCDATGFHLTRIRGYIGNPLTHPQSDMRTSMRADKAPERSMVGLHSGSTNHNGVGAITNGSATSSNGLGSDIADSNWMTWL